MATSCEEEGMDANSAKKSRRFDRGWAWVVLLSTTVVMSSVPAIPHNFSLLYRDVVQSMNISATTTSWIFNSHTLFLNVAGLLSVGLISLLGHRLTAIIFGSLLSLGILLSSFSTSAIQLFLTFGAIAGIGAGVSLLASYFITVAYFEKYRGLAIGCVTGSASVGRIATPFLIQYLLRQYGARGVIFIYSAITLNIIPAAMTFLPPPNKSSEVDKETPSPHVANQSCGRKCLDVFKGIFTPLDFKLFRNPCFWMLLMMECISWMIFMNVSFILPEYLIHLGFPGSPELFLTIMPCVDLVARIIVPLSTDWKILSIFQAYILGPIFTSLGLSGLLILTSSVPWLLFASCVYSFGTGILNSMIGMLIIYYFSVEKLPSCYSFLNISKGLFVITFGTFLGKFI